MSTEQKFTTFFEIFRLKNTELWESRLNHFQMLGTGDLQLLYHQSHDILLLRLNNTSWVLDKDLQIIGSRSLEKTWQSYSIVSPGGFFCLKMSGLDFTKQHPELVNFEAILEERTSFARNNSLESKINLFHEQEKGGLTQIAGSIMKVVESVTHTLGHPEHYSHPNYQIVRPVNDLLDVDSKRNAIVDVPEDDIGSLKVESKMLISDFQGLGEWKGFWESSNHEQLSKKFGGLNIEGQQSEEKRGEQEKIGSESQRVPAYEVDQSSKELSKGFAKASSQQKQGASNQEKVQEDTDFTTGLLKGDYQPEGQTPVTPYHKNEMQNPPQHLNPASDINDIREVSSEKNNGSQKLNPASDLSDKIDLPKESLNLQSWGSNVTNPSETAPNVDPDFSQTPTNSEKVLNLSSVKSDTTLPSTRPSDLKSGLDLVSEGSENMKETAAP